jgi:hypothetical protein
MEPPSDVTCACRVPTADSTPPLEPSSPPWSAMADEPLPEIWDVAALSAARNCGDGMCREGCEGALTLS